MRLLLTMAILLGFASASSAQVAVRIGNVRVQIGDPLIVETPCFDLLLGGILKRKKARLAPTAPPVVPAPAPRNDPAPGDPPSVPEDATPAVPVMTVDQFAKTFKPTKAGTYEVTVQHTFTGKPVTLTLNLPDGSPRRIKASRLKLELDYGKRSNVVVRFYRNGTVRVK